MKCICQPYLVRSSPVGSHFSLEGFLRRWCVVLFQSDALIGSTQEVISHCVVDVDDCVAFTDERWWCVLFSTAAASRICVKVGLDVHALRSEGVLGEVIVVEAKHSAAGKHVFVCIDDFIGSFTCAGNDQLIRLMPPLVEVDHEVSSF